MLASDEQSDRHLVENAIGGNKSAFGHLVGPHISRLIVLAKRMLGSASDAEDAVQDALASVWMARHRFDPERPIGPYLSTTVLNKCRDRLRRRKAAAFFGMPPQLDEALLPDQLPNPEAQAITQQSLAMLRKEIEVLPIRLREALVLVAIDGRSQIDAADLLGVTKKTIETRIYRARKHLREKFETF